MIDSKATNQRILDGSKGELSSDEPEKAEIQIAQLDALISRVTSN